MVKDGKVIANVSVNLSDYLWKGKRWKFLQLGTVMTDEEYRNKGLIRQLMEEIDKDYKDSIAGVFLFANDEVLNFYPKFGFQEAKEYAYVIAEVDESQLILHGVFAKQECNLDKIITAFGKEIRQVRLTFAPKNKDGYQVLPHKEEDCTLFVKGKGLEGFGADKIRFPELAHA